MRHVFTISLDDLILAAAQKKVYELPTGSYRVSSRYTIKSDSISDIEIVLEERKE